MLNMALKGFSILRSGCLFISTIVNGKKCIEKLVEKSELERQAYQYEYNTSTIDPTQALEQVKYDSTMHFGQFLLFGCSSYRVLSGEVNTIDLAISCSATALTLYPYAQKAAESIMENETVAAATKKIFYRI